jgi:sulfatase maturation enzyme AslB (radical SAM superfamily)
MRKKQTEPYISTYLHAKGRQMGLPIAGNFELTARCNFDCPMCYVHLSESDAKAQGKELTAQQWLQIAKDACDKGMVFVLLTGGEPFVRKDFFEILHGMQDLGLYVSINSNGSMLSGRILEQLLERPPFRMNISLYGGCNETYEAMCGKPAYAQVKENIRALRQAGVEGSINLSITPYNQQDLEKIHADATELGVNVRASSYMYPSVRVNGGQFGCGNRLSPEEAAVCGVRWDLLRFSKEEFLQKVNSAFSLNLTNIEIKIISYTSAGRVSTLKLGQKSVKATALRKALGLRSTDFTFEVTSEGITFFTKGYGHGVGLSQFGANELAKQGKNYKEILTHYYTGTDIKKI